jgi:hypothetical protein
MFPSDSDIKIYFYIDCFISYDIQGKGGGQKKWDIGRQAEKEEAEHPHIHFSSFIMLQ